jgi:crossover junction endodeoxyribonuclease RuvC
MRVFGIDCGTDCTGYGVVEWSDSGHAGSREPCLVALASGGIRLPKKDTMAQKLAFVYRELMLLLAVHEPEMVAIEEVFYSANVKSALKLGQVRGVALLAAANCGLSVAEYAPLKIKSSVVGYGLAQKEQVQFMVARLLRLECVPEPADAADALAVAICHLHTAQTLAGQLGTDRSGAKH